MGLPQCCEKLMALLFHYETLKIVDIKNKKVGACFRCIQLLIMSYVIGYVIIHKKGYQETDRAISTVSTKLKGTAFVNYGNFSRLINGIQVYDPSDYVIPPQETSGFFVMTNMIITPTQQQSTCPENPKFKDNWCKTDQDCTPMEMVRNGNGVLTGKCVDTPVKPGVRVCEIYGWCPVEVDRLPMEGPNFSKTVPLLHMAEDFTVLIRNHVTFPKFGIQRRNIIGYKSRRQFRKCIYHKEDNPYCPIFRLGDIIRYCGDNFTEVAFKGAIYGVFIHWNCNFDFNLENCFPTYDFARMDDPDAPISPGYNFRFSNYYVEGSKKYRTLTKAYGIKFQVLVHTKAGKFGPVPLFMNLGAGLALLGFAKVCCDFLVIYCVKKRKVYKQHKYDRVDDDDCHSESAVTTDSADEAEDILDEESSENKKVNNGKEKSDRIIGTKGKYLDP